MTTTVSGQTALLTAGGTNSGSNGSVSYSVGEVGYTVNSNGNYSMTAGMQQPFEISVLATNTLILENKQLSVYPNPTEANVLLAINLPVIENLNYTLFDINGKMLSNATPILVSPTAIPLQLFPSGTYLLYVNVGSKNSKTFKIIKK